MACSTLPGGVLYSTWRGGGGRGRAPQPGSRRRRVDEVVVKAVAAKDQDCNDEDCAPEKEVGKVSMEWKATENTQVIGTFPPVNKKKWTGYVEKDTAGQTNIYAVEPTVYVSENLISSNTAGDSTEGSEQTLVVAVGLGLGLLLGAGLVLRSVSTPPPSSSSSSSPPLTSSSAAAANNLSYYIQKFTPPTPEESVPVPPPAQLMLSSPALQEEQPVDQP